MPAHSSASSTGRAKALAYEKTIAQLWVVIGAYVQQVEALKGRLAWLHQATVWAQVRSQRSPRFGGRSGASRPNQRDGGAGRGWSAQALRRRRQSQRLLPHEPEASSGAAKGPQRQRRLDLPEHIIEHRLGEAERTCPICGKLRPELRLTEESQQIEWEVRLVGHRHVRHRYGPSCECSVRPRHRDGA